MNATSYGFAVGLIIGLIAIILLFKYANRDGKIKTEYDERQKAVRGKAYKYAFYTVVFAQAILMWFNMTGLDLPVADYVLQFIVIIAGCTVLATYTIWNDVYWGLNNDHKKYQIIFAIAFVLNILPLVMNIIHGSMYEDGKLGMPMLNAVVIIMMVIVFAELLIKRFADKYTDEEA
ncbi:MAG: hypothetical protein K6E49_05105 [Lachnospiraceae bacterium]|nr:hypothetical protein [Lachnospiraceae bacterium]